ncbi:uncharacterized protein UTRI_00504 [Ustilago trichophora]|uniref:Uncharacterized protein n=1 Tax=Ustilago trichophora TaxID=86804 RepID=A0A5C3DUB9_9BASI|nr:uncharacterized protein UTRI_00504 [Ustilago trichophora]
MYTILNNSHQSTHLNLTAQPYIAPFHKASSFWYDVRRFQKDASLTITPADGGDPIPRETVGFDTGHNSESGRFIARVWRTPSVLNTSSAPEDSGACQVIARAVRRTATGDTPDILCEASPIEFPAGQSSVLLDAGAICTVPESDISITGKYPSATLSMIRNDVLTISGSLVCCMHAVVRLSKKQVINVTFKYQTPTGLQTRFPGVPVSNNSVSINHADARAIRSRSDDERLLQTILAAYIAQTEVKSVQNSLPESDDANAAVPTVSYSSKIPYGGNLQTSLSPEARSALSSDDTFAALFNAGTPPSDLVQAQASGVPSTSMAGYSLPMPSPPKESENEASPHLAHRAWANIGSAIANIASTIAPVRTSATPRISPSSTSTSPNLQHAQPASATTIISDEQSRDRNLQAVPKTRARSHSEGDAGSNLAASLNELIGEIVHVLDDVQESQWADAADDSAQSTTDLEGVLRAGQIVEQNVQTIFTEEPRAVGVSYHEGLRSNMPADQVGFSSIVIQPLALPMGSGTPAPSPLQTNPETSATSNLENANTEALAKMAQPSNELNSITEDVQMEDTSNALEQIPQTHSTTVPLNLAKEIILSTEATQPAASFTTLNDDMQFVSCSIGTQTDGMEDHPPASGSNSHGLQPMLSSLTSDVPLTASQRLAISSSSSDAPLAAENSPPKTQPEAMNASGTMVLATMAQSPHAVAGMFGNASIYRRLGRSRSGASPAPSVTTSMGSTFTPSSQRMTEVFRYLMDKVLDDKDKDDLECEKLVKVRAKHAAKFEAVKRRYEQDLIANNVELEVIRAGVSLKRDTLRLLRSQYRSQVRDSRFRAKTFVDSRIGSNRRSRSLSRGPVRSHSPTIVGSRMATPVASEVPASMVKRERIDLTRDGDIDDGGSGAGASQRTGRRATSTSRSLGRALGLDRAAREPAFKVGNISDLMKNSPSSRTKRSVSCLPGKENGTAISRSATTCASGVPADNMQFEEESRENTASQTVEQWRFSVERARAISKAPTYSGTMPPASLSRTRGITPNNPIIVLDDEQANAHHLLVREGKKRALSRSQSICSQFNHISSHKRRVEQIQKPYSSQPTPTKLKNPEGSMSATAIVVRDEAPLAVAERVNDSSDEDDEEELPLFMGHSQLGERAGSANTEFSTLFSPDSLA